MSRRIEDYCQANDIPLFGKITFDTRVVEALVNGKSVVEYAKESRGQFPDQRGVG